MAGFVRGGELRLPQGAGRVTVQISGLRVPAGRDGSTAAEGRRGPHVFVGAAV